MRRTNSRITSAISNFRSKVALILMILLWAGHLTAIAADWSQIDRTDAGDTLSIDSSSIERNGSVVQYTEQIVFKHPRQTQRHGLLKSLRTRYAMNCKNQTNAPLSLHAVSTTGEVTGLTPEAMANPEFTAIAENPRAPDRIVFNYLCSQK